MIDPQTASDQEVDAWLWTHCLGRREDEKEAFQDMTSDEWRPTEYYLHCTTCEAKVRDRWVLYYSGHENTWHSWAMDSDRIDIDGHPELSARARLVVAILQYESNASP
jgi:hypothetical protein